MAVAAIDTHEVVKELQAAGFTEGQAAAVSRVVLQVRNIDLSNLATKADLANLATKAELAETRADLQASIVETRADLAVTRADLQASIAETRARLETTIAETKTEILKWMVSTIGLQTVVIVGAVVTLVRLLR